MAPRSLPTLISMVLKLFLQLLVGLSIGLRLLALGRQLRRQWLHDGRSASRPGQRSGLAGDFRRELHRRGLLTPLPPSPAGLPPGGCPGDPSTTP
jgi:hypothetical protein